MAREETRPSRSSSPVPKPRSGPTPPAPAAPARRQPVILKPPSRPGRARCAEVAGRTAADCASVCCCGPCMVVNLVLLTAVRLPRGLCRRALRARDKRRERLRKRKDAGLLGLKAGAGGDRVSAATTEDFEGDGKGLHESAAAPPSPAEAVPSLAEVDREMWAQFRGTGFWRSPSQCETRH